MSGLELIVIRHGETQWNREGRIQGWQDQPLTLEGVRQARAVAEALKPAIDPSGRMAFWMSPLPRAVQTASLLADAWNLPFRAFRPDPALREMGFGRWEGLTRDEIGNADPDGWKRYRADAWSVAAGGGESRAVVEDRLRLFLSKLQEGRPHVLVTHSVCLHVLRRIFSGVGPADALAYSAAQTTAFRLCPGRETPIAPTAEALLRFGCRSPGTMAAL
ncbi:histidine phosphatase family protein [Aureimonas frigidaquae]|uniref:Phosphoglycerate/bisphosphoglycerate mutase n=1 Tax=Aureimonas frigidaquae TaxID=424757 RepID=A0A0P0Z3F3_9HYPH|nr:histidine phosphatase family protein [Aureimonas frigidaquae]BAT28568.1 phosphoglycerate/bisphosphoglycerate mutase [Aureimonas frigidaquae]